MSPKVGTLLSNRKFNQSASKRMLATGGLNQSQSRQSLKSPTMRNTDNNFNSRSFFRDNEIQKAYGNDQSAKQLIDLNSPAKKNNFEKKDFRISNGAARRNIQSAKS